jgi:sugar transferase (PEP-CTERM system associated)
MLRIFGHFVPISTLLLGLAEIALMSAAVYLLLLPVDSIYAEYAADRPALGPVQFALVLGGLVALAMSAVGLYSQDVFLDYRVMALKIVLAFVLATPAAFLAALFFKNVTGGEVNVWSLWYLKAAFVWFVCVAITRTIFAQLTDGDAFKRRVLVIGTGARAEQLMNAARRGRKCHYVPVAFVRACNDPMRVPSSEFVLEDAAYSEQLAEFAYNVGAQEVVIATDDRRGMPIRQLLHCKLHGLKVTDYLSFWERENGRVNLDALQPSWLIFSDGFRSGWIVNTLKRSFDVLVSAIMLLFTAPLLIATALAIKLESSGPALYRQERVGFREKTFTLLKFRSMRTDAECDGKPQWAAERDPRVTRVGALIRKVRIDELPQLFNVLRGDMSFIGPRPERRYFVDQLAEQIPFYNERHAVKPGISGWAQINYPYGASLEDARQKLSYDLYYVKNRTIFLDLLILIQTVRVILFPSGAR